MDHKWNLTLDIDNLEEKADTHNFAHPTGSLNKTETERQMFFICTKIGVRHIRTPFTQGQLDWLTDLKEFYWYYWIYWFR